MGFSVMKKTHFSRKSLKNGAPIMVTITSPAPIYNSSNSSGHPGVVWRALTPLLLAAFLGNQAHWSDMVLPPNTCGCHGPGTRDPTRIPPERRTSGEPERFLWRLKLVQSFGGMSYQLMLMMLMMMMTTRQCHFLGSMLWARSLPFAP